MGSSPLKLLPIAEYTGVNRHDPIRFYNTPIIGKLYRKRVELCLAELTGGKRVLEVGFGTGVTFLNLREQYKEIHGIDLTADVAPITELWRRHNVETHLRGGSVLELPYPDDHFDSVLLISILEHLKPEQQPIAMNKIRRVLKPGGQMVYGVPVERLLMVLAFRVLGTDIRKEHFSTEKDVSAAADRALERVHVTPMRSLAGAVYEVGHFRKPQTKT